MEKVGDVPRAGGRPFSKRFLRAFEEFRGVFWDSPRMFFPIFLIGKDRIPVPFDSPSVALKTLLRRS